MYCKRLIALKKLTSCTLWVLTVFHIVLRLRQRIPTSSSGGPHHVLVLASVSHDEIPDLDGIPGTQTVRVLLHQKVVEIQVDDVTE